MTPMGFIRVPTGSAHEETLINVSQIIRVAKSTSPGAAIYLPPAFSDQHAPNIIFTDLTYEDVCRRLEAAGGGKAYHDS